LETCEEKSIGISVNPADGTIFDPSPRSNPSFSNGLQESIIVG
jgi:hypothetical protein